MNKQREGRPECSKTDHCARTVARSTQRISLFSVQCRRRTFCSEIEHQASYQWVSVPAESRKMLGFIFCTRVSPGTIRAYYVQLVCLSSHQLLEETTPRPGTFQPKKWIPKTVVQFWTYCVSFRQRLMQTGCSTKKKVLQAYSGATAKICAKVRVYMASRARIK